jgi:hypothetical protein
VGGFQIDRACFPSVHRFEPGSSANAPRIACFEARKIELGGRRHEVVTSFFGESQEGFVHDATDRVRTTIGVVGVATPVSIPTREWVV